jgi:hypothetical protein
MMPALVQGEMLSLMQRHGISSLADLRGSNYRI